MDAGVPIVIGLNNCVVDRTSFNSLLEVRKLFLSQLSLLIREGTHKGLKALTTDNDKIVKEGVDARATGVVPHDIRRVNHSDLLRGDYVFLTASRRLINLPDREVFIPKFVQTQSHTRLPVDDTSVSRDIRPSHSLSRGEVVVEYLNGVVETLLDIALEHIRRFNQVVGLFNRSHRLEGFKRFRARLSIARMKLNVFRTKLRLVITGTTGSIRAIPKFTVDTLDRVSFFGRQRFHSTEIRVQNVLLYSSTGRFTHVVQGLKTLNVTQSGRPHKRVVHHLTNGITYPACRQPLYFVDSFLKTRSIDTFFNFDKVALTQIIDVHRDNLSLRSTGLNVFKVTLKALRCLSISQRFERSTVHCTTKANQSYVVTQTFVVWTPIINRVTYVSLPTFYNLQGSVSNRLFSSHTTKSTLLEHVVHVPSHFVSDHLLSERRLRNTYGLRR